MNLINPSRGDLRFDGTLNVWDGVAWIPVQDPKANYMHQMGLITSLCPEGMPTAPLAKRPARIIPISIGAFFTGCLVFGLAHFLIAPHVHGACALNATPYQLTYTEACK